MGNFYIVSSFAHPSNRLLFLQVGGKTGKTRFIAKKLRGNSQIEKINLSAIASEKVLAEIKAKSIFNVKYGNLLQTILVSGETKNFIESCWKELKVIKPQFCIK